MADEAKDYRDLSLEDFMEFELRNQAWIVHRMEPTHRKELSDEALDLANYYGKAILQPGVALTDAIGYSATPNAYTLWKKYLAVYTLLTGWFLEEDLKAKEEALEAERAKEAFSKQRVDNPNRWR